MRQNNNGSLKEGFYSIVDICKRKTQRREILQFLQRKQLKHIEDVMHSDGTSIEKNSSAHALLCTLHRKATSRVGVNILRPDLGS